MELKSHKDLQIGTVLESYWGGMADFFEVIKTTPKSVTFREVKWETTVSEDPDPLYRAVKISLDENGRPVPMLDYNGEEILIRKQFHFLPNGSITFTNLGYKNSSISIVKDLHKVYNFYWG